MANLGDNQDESNESGPPPTSGLRRGLRWLVAAMVLGVAVLGGLVAANAIGQRSPLAAATNGPSPSQPSATPSQSSTPSVLPSAPATAVPSPKPSPALPGWATVTIPDMGFVNGIAERDGRVVVAGSPEGSFGIRIAVSDDGQTWTPALEIDSDADLVGSIAAGAGGFAASATTFDERMGIPEISYLYSTDGLRWLPADPPDHCTFGSISAHASGYVSLGGRCKGEGDFAPSDLHVLNSPDGRSWTSHIVEGVLAGAWATDGERLVVMADCNCPESYGRIWTSDDVGSTWSEVLNPFPPEVSTYALAYANGRYLVSASWLIRQGDPDSGACVSDDGEVWTCQIIPDGEGDLAGRQQLGMIIGTSTGFVSLAYWSIDEFVASDSEMIIGTSGDGLAWTFGYEPDLTNLFHSGAAATGHGLFVWGGTNPNLRPEDISQPFLAVHRAPLP